jgi:hypothetical protein
MSAAASVPPLLLDVALTAVCGKATVDVTTRDNELYMNLTSLSGLQALSGALPDKAVLQPLVTVLQQFGFAETKCHLQVLGKTVLKFSLGSPPLNLQDVVVRYLNSLLG